METFRFLRGHLNEKTRRLFAGAFAKTLGERKVSMVARALGLSRNTVLSGIKQVHEDGPVDKVRAPGGGRKRIKDKDPEIIVALESLVEPVTRGDPESPLRWTCKSTRKLAQELKGKGHKVSPRTVARLLHSCNYSLQANRKRHEGSSHPDRDAQFSFINEKVKAFNACHQPVISVDAKKKELIGDFKNNGREWQKTGRPEEVNVYDFVSLGEGRVTPYGVFDVFRNEGWVNVGIDHDTAAFAVESVRRWWRQMGEDVYPQAKRLLITADGGGSNGSRTRLWKTEIQRFADEAGLEISVCHYPPGTSKWNAIEHRLFSFISQNWRGKPLRSYSTMVNLIAATTTSKGLTVKCVMDKNSYPYGIKVTDKDLSGLIIYREEFHGEWNYTIVPRKKRRRVVPSK